MVLFEGAVADGMGVMGEFREQKVKGRTWGTWILFQVMLREPLVDAESLVANLAPGTGTVLGPQGHGLR